MATKRPARPGLFKRIRRAIRKWKAQHRKSNFMVWAEKEIALAKTREHDHKEDGDCPSMDKYADSIYDCALQLAKVFDKQNHSGMSAGLATGIFRQLVAWKPLTPINGTEDEWNIKDEWCTEDESGLLHQQNRRCSSIFRTRKTTNEPWSYTYNEILDIVNGDEVWATYPPVEEPGILDDNDPKVKAYFEKVHALRDKLNGEITFPYSPQTHKYSWNFNTSELEEIK